MSLVRRIPVGDQERVLLIRKGRFVRILDPGEYWIWAPGAMLETHNVREVQFASPWADYLAKERREIAERTFTIVETSDAQVAVVYVDRKLALTVAPGKRLMFWRGPMEVTAELIGVKDHPEVPQSLLQALVRLGSGVPVTYAGIDEGHTGLLFIENRLVRAVSPGLYGFWNAAGSPRVEVVDLRLQTLEIPGQEILTQDKVSIRVNVWAEFQVVDAVKAKESVKDYAKHLYRTVQRAVRQALGRWRKSLPKRPASVSRWNQKYARRWRPSAFAWAPLPSRTSSCLV